MTDVSSSALPQGGLSLLAWCSRPTLPADQWPELRRRAASIGAWPPVLVHAERHGLAPLLYRHLHDAGLRFGDDDWTRLQGLFLRHRHANRVRRQALRDIVDALATRGIDVRVLKGMALMHLVYPDAALRPVADLDLLVPPDAADAVLEELRRRGFATPQGLVAHKDRHHLPGLTQTIAGVPVQIEVHVDAISRDNVTSLTMGALRGQAVGFSIEGTRVQTLSVDDMVWQLAEHMVGPLPRPLRMIWLADIRAWAERFVADIDWTRVRVERPVVGHVLALAHAMSPLSPSLIAALRLPSAGGARGAGEAGEWIWEADHTRAGFAWAAQAWRLARPPAWWRALRFGPPGSAQAAGAQVRYLRTATRALGRRLRRARS